MQDLEAHYERHSGHWQSIWTAAKGWAALGEPQLALAAWRRAWKAHPDRSEIVREYGMALLHADCIDEAWAVNRDVTTRLPRDATLWCNRAVTEILHGDLLDARQCVQLSQELDPSDRIAQTLSRLLSTMSETSRLPKTLRELERWSG